MSEALDWLERQPTRRCLGPLNEDLSAVLARMEREAERAEAAAGSLKDEARAKQLAGVSGKHRAAVKAARASKEKRTGAAIGRLLAGGLNAEASHLKRLAHAGCGADLNPTIFAEVEEDGESHEFTCPSCGTLHHATRVPVAAE